MNCNLWPGFNFECDEMPGYMLDYREKIDNFEYFGLYKIIIPHEKYSYIGKICFHIHYVEKHIFDFGTIKKYNQLELF